MKKQKFLDQESTDTVIVVTQELLKSMGKTQLSNAVRSLNQLDSCLWKSWMKSMAFEDIIGCAHAALSIIKEDESNNMED